MTPKNLLSKLTDRNIELRVRRGRLQVGPPERLTEADLELLRKHASAILEILRSDGTESESIGPRGCGAHNNPADWTYTADRYGRPEYRTVHCRLCGSFIGYQPPQQP